MITANHSHSIAFSSKICETVDQLNRTNVENPNNGSMFLLKNCLVLGSDRKL